ncbi:MAG: ABC transporter ATP-binding protein [Deltaproteobacteria bacterium RBG_16_71_12]|nr:MAG: ABC transporter ATP-binding protein [Deltaproteobacteria bacterium RBG_16_71_12]
MVNEPVLRITDLTRRFGVTTALDAVNLAVQPGTVHGLVGENGAGKTTLIRHVLGLLKARIGTVRVFGRDPVEEPVAVLSRIGYLSEENDLPGWMRVDELIRYTRAFHQGWDDAYAEELRQAFALDPAAKIKGLSKGQKARAGLLVALAHRPDLLVLDEPSSGLDPIVRRDILGAIIRTVAQEGRTVLFSSHLLEEVEQVADHVTMIHHGKVVLSAPLDDIKGSHRCVTMRFAHGRDQPAAIDGVVRWDGAGAEWTALARGTSDELANAASSCGGTIVSEHVPSLDEVFVAYVGRPATSGRDA